MYTIFVVDDQASILLALRRSMRGLFHVLGATSLPEAIDLLAASEDRIDAVIVDGTVGEQAGAFIEAVKDRWPLVAVVVLSAYAEDEITVSDYDAYVAKPWDDRALAELVHRLVDEKRDGSV